MTARLHPALDSYRYAMLAPRREASNEAFLGQNTLGIEVTVPDLAARCGLGNLDPQHSGHDASQAAIEAALQADIPPPGSTLATVRPDPDAFGAMAVLAMRCAGLPLGADALRRIDMVARADRFDRGSWPGPRPLPTTVAALEKDTMDESELVAIRGACFDTEMLVTQKVSTLLTWLQSGKEPPGYRERWRAAQQRLIDSLNGGEMDLKLRYDGRIATLETTRTDALGLAYYLAPVVVARNPAFRWPGAGEPHVRYAVAQWQLGWIDLLATALELADGEPGWGGSPTIIGSPQGRGSELNLEAVASIAARHLKPGKTD